MKRMVSKIFCVIMALCVFLGAMPVMSFAEKDVFEGYGTTYIEGENVAVVNPEQVNDTLIVPGQSAQEFFGTTTLDESVGWRFYDMLNDAGKYVYNKFVSSGPVATLELDYDINDSPFVGVGATVNDAANAAVAVFSEALSKGLVYAVEDNPEFFWFAGYSGSQIRYAYAPIDGGYIVKLAPISIPISIKTSAYADISVVQDYYNRLLVAVEEVEVNGITRYEKVKSINDYICNVTTYDSTAPMAHEPTGVFFGGRAVCEGYAEVFKLLCDREGIPCITVLGYDEEPEYAHKWNYVQMEDGKWYLVDATWNDQGEFLYNDYLLNGSETIAPNFVDPNNPKPDSAVHVPTGVFYSDGSQILYYPILEKDTYGMMMLNDNVGDITIEDSMNVIFVGKDITDLSKKFLLPSGFSGTVTSFTDVTGGELAVTKTATGVSKTYMFAKRGDIDGSNTTNITDYDKVVTASTLGSCPEKNTAEYYAGDINHDGAIDGFDAIALDLYLEDTLKFN